MGQHRSPSLTQRRYCWLCGCRGHPSHPRNQQHAQSHPRACRVFPGSFSPAQRRVASQLSAVSPSPHPCSNRDRDAPSTTRSLTPEHENTHPPPKRTTWSIQLAFDYPISGTQRVWCQTLAAPRPCRDGHVGTSTLGAQPTACTVLEAFIANKFDLTKVSRWFPRILAILISSSPACKWPVPERLRNACLHASRVNGFFAKDRRIRVHALHHHDPAPVQ